MNIGFHLVAYSRYRLFPEKESDSSLSRPLISCGTLGFVKDRNLGPIFPGLIWIVFARSIAWHPLGTLFLAHFAFTS